MYTPTLNKKPQLFTKDLLVLSGLAFLLFILHMIDNLWVNYGIFRDEYYYLACTQRLSWGYVDQPPLSIFVLALVRPILGDSLFAIRLVPALALAFTVFFTGLTVRAMGGKTIAIVLAAVAIMVGPIFLAMGSYYSMNSLDMMLWSMAAYLVVRLIQNNERKHWLWLGLVMGLGLMNKIGFLWFGFGLLVGLLLSPRRKTLLTPWPYIAGGIAFLFFVPFIIWNINHDFAHLEFMRNAVNYKYNTITRMDFITEQFLMVSPIVVVLTISGLYFFFFDAYGKVYRTLGVIFLATFLILLINGHSKGEYMASAYPLIYTGGGMLLERLVAKKTWKWVPYVLLFLLITGGMLLAPIVVTVLPVPAFIRYSAKLGITPGNSEGKELSELPQFYADRFGWESLAADVSEVYQTLPEAEQQQTVVYAQNYGEAASLEYYSKTFPLPQIISGHNAYWFWGYGHNNLSTVIIVGGTQEDHLESFEEVEQVSVHEARYAMPYETNLPIFICRKLKHPAGQVWEGTKNFI